MFKEEQRHPALSLARLLSPSSSPEAQCDCEDGLGAAGAAPHCSECGPLGAPLAALLLPVQSSARRLAAVVGTRTCTGLRGAAHRALRLLV